MSTSRIERIYLKQREQSRAAKARIKPKHAPPLENRLRSMEASIRRNGLRDEQLFATEEDGIVWLRNASGHLRMCINPTTFHALQDELRAQLAWGAPC